jgi:hypothetical protein
MYKMSESKFLRTARRIIRENPEVFEALLEFERTGRLPAVAELKKRNLAQKGATLIKQ